MGCHFLEVAERTEEVVYSWHNEGEVPQVANCGLEFLGSGSFVRGSWLMFVVQATNLFSGREIIFPTKDDL